MIFKLRANCSFGLRCHRSAPVQRRCRAQVSLRRRFQRGDAPTSLSQEGVSPIETSLEFKSVVRVFLNKMWQGKCRGRERGAAARPSSNLLGCSLPGWMPPPLARCPDPRGPSPRARGQLSGEGVPGPGGTFILAERRERCSQARGRRTEPFCLDFPPRYSNQQPPDKNAPCLDNGRASRFSPSPSSAGSQPGPA